MKYPRLLFVAVTAMLALTGCKDEAKQDIADTFESFMSAIQRHDSAAALPLIDDKYFEDLGYLIQAAKSAPREKVFRMRPSERRMIILIRNRIAKEELATLDGRGLMKYLIEERDPGDDDIELWGDIKNIKLRPPRATAEMEIEDLGLRLQLEFIEVDHVWKVNPAAFDEKFDKRVERVSVKSGKREDTLLQERETRLSGKPVNSGIWDPPK